jgi:hypothetical protein
MAATAAATVPADTVDRGTAAALVEFRPVFMTLYLLEEMDTTDKIDTGICYR